MRKKRRRKEIKIKKKKKKRNLFSWRKKFHQDSRWVIIVEFRWEKTRWWRHQVFGRRRKVVSITRLTLATYNILIVSKKQSNCKRSGLPGHPDMAKLTSLHLCKCWNNKDGNPIGNEAIPHLRSFPQVKILTLARCGISANGLEALSQLSFVPKLEKLIFGRKVVIQGRILLEMREWGTSTNSTVSFTWVLTNVWSERKEWKDYQKCTHLTRLNLRKVMK